MAVNWLQRLAARASVPVFPVLGMRGEEARRLLTLTPGIELVDSPRHASVLLVAGGVPPDLFESLRRVHDQLPQPFTTLWFQSEPLPDLKNDRRVDALEALPAALTAAHRELMSGQRASSPRLLPDVPPHPWEGLGDDGHGGEGMMGGTPYGRPMAMNMADDIRDGLTLDSLTFRLGPFYPALPAGMAAEVTLQGDLIQTWKTKLAPFPLTLDTVFYTARREPVPIAELELARARHALHRLFQGLRIAGLELAALQALRLAESLTPESRIDGLRDRLSRSGLFTLALLGKGQLDEKQARAVGGSAARAAGIEDDLRLRDDAYRRLGFAPITQTQGDTRARWRQLLAEIEQSLRLARLAVQQTLYTSETGVVETPRGPWAERCPGDVSVLLDELLPGLEWGEALATIASLEVAGISPWAHDSRPTGSVAHDTQ